MLLGSWVAADITDQTELHSTLESLLLPQLHYLDIMAVPGTRPSSSTAAESLGRVGTLGERSQSSPTAAHNSGMFIIDHFEAEERDGQLVPTDEGVVRHPASDMMPT